MPTVPITWQTPLTNAIINGSGDLEKNAGSDNCFTNASGTGDAGARSVETITSGDFEFGCTLGPIGGASGRTYVGLDNGSFSLDFGNWQYALHVSTELNTSGTPHPANSVFVYQGPAPNKTYLDGVWTNSGQLLRFVCTNGVMRAYLDSLLLYTFSGSPTYPLFACASLACLNKTVIDPYFITSAGGGGACSEGVSSGSGCSAPWTIPTPAAFPTHLNGGPRLEYFDEVEPDWGEHSQRFPDGNPVANTIQTTRIRRFAAEWQGLSAAEAAIVDAHWESTRGGLPFTLTHPYTTEVITGVRYESFRRSPGPRVWSQNRSARLVKYTN